MKQLDKLFDPKNDSMTLFRESNALRSALRLMEVNKHSGTAFPPFHAKFFADKYCPRTEKASSLTLQARVGVADLSDHCWLTVHIPFATTALIPQLRIKKLMTV